MAKRRMRSATFFLILGLVLAASGQNAFSQSENCFLWRVQSKTATAYLLGSIHMLKKENYPLNTKIESAFDQSNVLGVEANITDIGKMDLQKLMGTAFYPETDSLENHISKETYALVRKEVEGLGISPQILDRQKPWFLAMTLESLQLLKLGYDPSSGVDIHFLVKAKEKRIVELESLDDQFNLLSGLSDQDQERFLLYTVKDLDILGREMDRLIRAWTSGDAKGVESIMTKSVNEDKRLSPIYEKLIYDRNRKMAAKIEDFLRTRDTYFVIVGAGHLVGDNGIVDILKGKGYLVEQR